MHDKLSDLWRDISLSENAEVGEVKMNDCRFPKKLKDAGA